MPSLVARERLRHLRAVTHRHRRGRLDARRQPAGPRTPRLRRARRLRGRADAARTRLSTIRRRSPGSATTLSRGTPLDAGTSGTTVAPAHLLVDDEERSTYAGLLRRAVVPAARRHRPRTAPPTAPLPVRRHSPADLAEALGDTDAAEHRRRSTAPRAGSSSRSTGSPDACGTPTWATVLPTYPSPPDQRSHRRRGAHALPEVGSGVGGRAAGVGGGDGLRPGRTAGRRVGAGGDRRTLRLPAVRPGRRTGWAYAGFAERRSRPVDPDHVLPVVDVTAALRLRARRVVRTRAGGAARSRLLPASRDR